MKKQLACLLGLALGFASGGAMADAFSNPKLVPNPAKPGQPVSLQITWDQCGNTSEVPGVETQGNVINVTFGYQPVCNGPNQPVDLLLPLGTVDEPGAYIVNFIGIDQHVNPPVADLPLSAPLIVNDSFDVSGNWFNLDQSGHGFQLELLPNNVLLVFWFTFDDNGNPAWISGIGQLVDNHVVMQAVQTLGGKFPPNFDPDDISKPAWGALQFDFTDCNHGHAKWSSGVPTFGNGEMDIVRLTKLQNNPSCP